MVCVRERVPWKRTRIEHAMKSQILRARSRYRNMMREIVDRRFFTNLIERTDNFSHVTWLGKPIWQNILDLWVIQETIVEVGPDLLIETGTNRGGSSWFYAQLFELMGRGRVITCDVERLHNLSHPRVEYLIGSSTEPETVKHIRAAAAAADGPVMVILDSDHRQQHVGAELECYAPSVTPGSYMLVQDGCIDRFEIFRPDRPGPLPAIHDYVARHPEFEIDRARSERFLISQHPDGWLRRREITP